MGHYTANLRDLEFNLFEMLGHGPLLDGGTWGDLDSETVHTILGEVAQLAEGPVAASFTSADRNPPVFDPDTHTVRLPDDFKKSFRAIWESGFLELCEEPAVGGVPAPKALQWAVAEMILGAQPAAFMYGNTVTAASIFYRQGTEEQKRWAQIIGQQNWGSTMVLTEPDAGSDVGASRAKAIAQSDGSWHIEGVKRFITNGDSDDLFDNIAHMVLARPEGAGPGTKGLSLFFVPKFLFDPDTGASTDRNGVFVTNLEHKMGLRVSATCELTFGGHGVPAKGWLVGEEHNGIAQMFEVIEHARMFVGTKAIATLSAGYLTALDYAKQRIQGGDLAQMADKNAPRVSIIRHPDVRRSLALQKAYTEGLRATYLFTAALHDPDVAQHCADADPDMAARLNDLMLPIVKGVGSERAYQYLAESLQTLGGSGFLEDYPIEQYVRDAKIDSLYEGTTAIQAQDFFFRKIIRDRGQALAHLSGLIQKSIDDAGAHPRLKIGRERLATALADVQAMTATLTTYLMAAQQDPTELYKVGLGSVRFLIAVGDLIVGWKLLQQANIAAHALDSAAGVNDVFYEGKVATALFFAKTILPELSASRAVLDDLDTDIMNLAEAAF